MTKKFVFGVSATIVLLVLSTMMTAAYASLQADGIVINRTYTFSIGPGGVWKTFSWLDDDAYGSITGIGRSDKFVMTVTSRTLLHIEVEDCCLMGDTIVIGTSASNYFAATSPKKISVDAWINPGTYTFYVGYIRPHTGIFPAGYDIYVQGS